MIFLDSSYIKGLILKNDDYNHQSKKIKPLLEKDAKIINLTVLVEVLNAVRRGNYERDIGELLFCLLNMDIFDFLDISDYENAMKWFEYYDRSINFSDCTIINIMVNHKITKIASFDTDFDKIKGFSRIHYEVMQKNQK